MQLLTTFLSSALLLALANAQGTSTSAELVVSTSSADVVSTSSVVVASTPSAIVASPTTAVVSGTAALTPAQSSQAACLDTCNANDATCRANCITAVPVGYSSQNATIECVSNCDKGDGSAAGNLAYENCLKACVASAPAAPSSTAAAATSANSEGSSSSGNAQTTSDAGAVATSTSSASPSSTSKSAADTVRTGVSLLGAVGLFAALFTL